MSKIDVICDYSQRELKVVPLRVLEMTNLKMLYLEGNFLETLPEDFFQKLPKLHWLDLRNNKLANIPEGIAYHAHLENLLLENNKITTLANEIGVVPNLKVLQLSGNPLQYPPTHVLKQGIQSICSYLKDEYDKINMPPSQTSEEAVSGNECLSIATSSSDSEKKMYVPELLKRSVTQAKLRVENHPVIMIKSLSDPHNNLNKETNGSNIKKAKSCTYPPHTRKYHKISKHCSKLSLHSHYNSNKYVAVKNIKVNDNKIIDLELKEIWLSKLKELLSDQEKILQQEKTLKALRDWRFEKKMEAPRLTTTNRKLQVPYDTDSKYDRMMSRYELTKEVDKIIRKRRNISKDVNIEKLVTDVVTQLKSLELNMQIDGSPRSQVESAEKEIQMIIDLHKRVTALQSKNDRF